MNRALFGYTRDLFKFDLVGHILAAFPELEDFTFIPMLTEETSTPGKTRKVVKDLVITKKKGKAGTFNQELMEEMGRLQEIHDDFEYFNTVRSYFFRKNIVADILHEDTFSHEHREDYFRKVLETFPEKSLIYLDPDTGLEVRNSTRRHLLFKEVRKIFDRMDHGSVLMIYQHIPGPAKTGYLRKRCDELTRVTDTTPVVLADKEIAFFFLVKNAGMSARLRKAVGNYAETYPELSTSGST
jgi:hypothetical protein